MKQQAPSNDPYFPFNLEAKKEMAKMDSMYWRGLKDARHDQLLRIIK